MDPVQRRAAILDAALIVIAQRGFAATTLRDVAAQAGVAHGLLRHHFGTREALLAAAFDHAAGAEIAALDDGPNDPVDAIAAYLQPTSPQHYLLWIDAWSEAPRNPELATTLAHHHQACAAHLRNVVARGRDAGVFTCPDPEEAIETIVALQDGLAVQEFGMRIIDRRTARTTVLRTAARALGYDEHELLAAGKAQAHA
jgi:AcrR family transcriptional regulator